MLVRLYLSKGPLGWLTMPVEGDCFVETDISADALTGRFKAGDVEAGKEGTFIILSLMEEFGVVFEAKRHICCRRVKLWRDQLHSTTKHVFVSGHNSCSTFTAYKIFASLFKNPTDWNY